MLIAPSLTAADGDNRSGVCHLPAWSYTPTSIWAAAPLRCPVAPTSSGLRYRVPMESPRQSPGEPKDAATAAEEVRVKRLREDARRPMNVNLAEGIALSHQLMQFTGAARRS